MDFCEHGNEPVSSVKFGECKKYEFNLLILNLITVKSKVLMKSCCPFDAMQNSCTGSLSSVLQLEHSHD
jgi:hypothetical protein